jgi:hypothetical protein
VIFREWLSAAWASIVGHRDPVQFARHLAVGTGVDFVEGARSRDPRRLAVYFSKHGAFVAKEYQNVAPVEWGDGSVGRFWGYWGLRPAVVAVEVAPDVARAVVRTARRYSDAPVRVKDGGGQVRLSAPHKVKRTKTLTKVTRDPDTGFPMVGVFGRDWSRVRRSRWVRVRRLVAGAGYLVVNDGPAFAASLARASQIQTGYRAGSGPVGFLP